MKKLLFVLVMWPGVVFGQTVGCFLSASTESCMTSPITIGNCRFYEYTLDQSLGVATGALCRSAIAASDGWQRALDGWKASNNDWAYESNMNAKTIKRKDNLVSRLRKACGNRCKAIK